MENRDFYLMESKLVLTTVQAPLLYSGNPEVEWELIKGDYQGIKFPLTFRQECGHSLRDILDTGIVSLTEWNVHWLTHL